MVVDMSVCSFVVRACVLRGLAPGTTLTKGYGNEGPTAFCSAIYVCRYYVVHIRIKMAVKILLSAFYWHPRTLTNHLLPACPALWFPED